MFYTYILESKQNGSYYIGSCQDIKKRISLHNRGLLRSTKRFCPWEVVHIEEYEDFKRARQRELKIKSWKKRSAVGRLINSSKF